MQSTLGIHYRRSIRLKGYDYSQIGAYFVTICAYNRELLFEDEGTKRILEKEWLNTRDIRQDVVIDEFVVMPNHLHGIIVITDSGGAYCNTPLQNRFKSPSKTVGAIIRGFKSTTTKQINFVRNTTGSPIWQRNYYDHIIRNEDELNRVREYIQTNPLRWHLDKENPERIGIDPSEKDMFRTKEISKSIGGILKGAFHGNDHQCHCDHRRRSNRIAV